MAGFWDTLLGKSEPYKMPENSPFPSVEDAVAARARGEFQGGPYQFWVQDQKATYPPPRGGLRSDESNYSATPTLSPAAQYAQPTLRELPETDAAMQQNSNAILGATRRPIDQPTQDMLAREALAAQRLYLTRLGFDPGRVMLMPKGVSYGGTAGEYSAPGDYSISDPRTAGNMVHESIHRAIQQLIDAKALPTTISYARPDRLYYEEEPLVRRVMQQQFGDIEAARRPQRYTDYLNRTGAPGAGIDKYIASLEEAAKNLLAARARPSPSREK